MSLFISLQRNGVTIIFFVNFTFQAKRVYKDRQHPRPNKNLNYQRYFLISQGTEIQQAREIYERRVPWPVRIKIQIRPTCFATRVCRKNTFGNTSFGETSFLITLVEKHAHHRCSSVDCFGKNSLVIIRCIFPVGTGTSNVSAGFINRKHQSTYLSKFSNQKMGNVLPRTLL